jgi:hypothetical protein
MATLKYDFAVVGSKNVKRAIMSHERMFVAHDAKMRRMFARSGGAHAGGTRVPRVAPAKAAKAVEKVRHRQAMADISVEERARLRAEHRIHRISRRNQKRRAREKRRDSQRDVREAVRAEQRARTQFRSAANGVGRRALGTVGAVGRTGLQAAALYGGFAVAGAVGAQVSGDRAKRNLANKAHGQFGGESREQLLSRISGATRPLSLQTGVAEADIAGMMGAFHGKAGGLDQAINLAPFMAQMSEATGSEMADVGEAAGSIFQAALQKGMDPKSAGKAVKEILLAMEKQAREGSIEMADIASLGSRIVSAGSKFEGGFEKNARTIGALAQIALGGGAASAQEATMSVMRLGPDIASREKQFKRAGVSIFTDKTKQLLRDPAELIMETVASTGGNQATISKLFGKQSAKTVDAFRGAYVSGGGGQGGMAAMQKLLAKFSSTTTEESLNTASDFSRKGIDTRLGKVREQFNEKLGPAALRVVERLIPALEQTIPMVEKTAEAFAGIVEWAASNPMTGIAVLVGASLTKEIAAAGIGALIRKLLMGGGGAPGGGLGSVGTLGTAGVTVGAVVATGVATYNAGMLVGEAADHGRDKRHNDLNTLKNLESMGEDPIVEENGKRFRLQKTREKTVERDEHGVFTTKERDVVKRTEIANAAKGDFTAIAQQITAAIKEGSASQKEAAGALKEAATSLKASPGGNRTNSPAAPI